VSEQIETAGARAAVLCVAGAAVLWSTGGLFIKVAPMPALAVAFGRAAVTSLFYLAVLRPKLSQARFSTALSYALCIVTFVLATRLTSAANAIFLQYTGPAYVLVLSPFILGERLRSLDLACVALSLAGMSLFFVGGGQIDRGQLTGNLLGAASGVFFALTVIFTRRDATTWGGGDAMPSITLGNLLAAAMTLPFVWTTLPAALSGRGLAVLLYLGVVQVGVAYILFARGVRRVPAAEASLISMLEPVLNPVWVFFGTGERPGPWALLGGGLVVLAVLSRTLLSGDSKAPSS